MKLSELLDKLAKKKVYGDVNNINISGVVYDPLRVKPGYLFIAINMYTQLDKIEIPDGHDVIVDAVNNGAAAVIIQREMDLPASVVKIIVPDTRYALALLSNTFYKNPSQKLKMIGITGTNGKTTTTHILQSILMQKYHTGLIGTLYYKIDGTIYNSKDTTPEPPDLQEIFSKMKNEGVDYCVMEVSSHGIDFHRVEGINYQTAVFTNLTQDHLDYHKTIEHYRETKMKLFKWLQKDNFAVINIDDPSAHYFLRSTKANVLTYGIHNQADITAKNIKITIKGLDFLLVTPTGEIKVHPKLVGAFNLYNILASVGVAFSQGFELETIKKGLEQKIKVNGRFELVDKGQAFSVVVDYAHTPDGVNNVLKLAKDLKPGRIITVFGCGGDRDCAKRPIMGKIVSEYSDFFVITADNPRNEDPIQIANHIKKGTTHKDFKEIIDRYEAIKYAIKQAQAGDIVMILGKGHETTQTLKDNTIHFNDVEVAEEVLTHLIIRT